MTRRPVPERDDDTRPRCPEHHMRQPCRICQALTTTPDPARLAAGDPAPTTGDPR